MADTREERSLGGLFGDLSRELGTLVRQEVSLARTELSAAASDLGRSIATLVAGGAFVFAALLALSAGAVIGLITIGMPAWLACLLVGLVLAVIGYALVQLGLTQLRRADLAPKHTVRTIKENVEFAKEHAT